MVKTYDYVDDRGELQFQVCRFKPKTFRQRRPNGVGGWTWNLQGVRRVLYRLPELLAADRKRVVYIVEGEKDVNALARLGRVATCNPGGAGKWRSEYGETFAGRAVVLIPDNDAAGEKHAQHIAAALVPIAQEVRIVSLPGLPVKGDVSDWLAAGGTRETLEALALKTAKLNEAEPDQTNGDKQNKKRIGCYSKTDNGITWHKPIKGGEVEVSLSNFKAKIAADLVHDDGAETIRNFEIEATIGKAKRTIIVRASRFASMQWVAEALGGEAILSAGFGAADRVREAVQLFSQPIKSRTVYTHSGWRKLVNRWVYLHSGGAIGGDNANKVNVELPGELKFLELPSPPTSEGSAETIRASLRLLDLAPARITAPIFAAIFRAVLGGSSFSLFLSGPTGTFKTELATLAQQHSGARFSSRNLPANFSSTANALEATAFACKDSVLVVDDYHPGSARADRQRLAAVADRLFRGAGNQAGRSRMRSDTTIRPAKLPRCLPIGTGEEIPPGHSLRARMLIVEMSPGEILGDKLTSCQRDAGDGLYAQAMAGFIAWLAPQLDSVRDELAREIPAARERLAEAGHRRTSDAQIELQFSAGLALKFAIQAGAIDAAEAELLSEKIDTGLVECAEAQSRAQSEMNPVVTFQVLLRSALAAGEAHLANVAGGEPKNPQTCGWRERDGTYSPAGLRVGCFANDAIYLDLAAAYRAAARMADGSGAGIEISAQTLRKRLHQAGKLVFVDDARNSLSVRRMIEGRRANVLAIQHEFLGFSACSLSTPPQEPDQPDIWDD